MKKQKGFLTVVLSAVMLVNMTAVCASAEESLSPSDFGSLDRPVFEKSETTRTVSYSDTVVLGSNSCLVGTPEGITISYTAPSDSNNVFCLTQDYLQQHGLFERFYDNPLETALAFNKDGMHLNIYDASDNIDIYIYIDTAPWASLYPDSDNLTETEADYILSYLKEELLPASKQSIYGVVGSNYYFYLDNFDTGTAYLLGSKGGYEILVEMRVADESAATDALLLLEGLELA